MGKCLAGAILQRIVKLTLLLIAAGCLTGCLFAPAEEKERQTGVDLVGPADSGRRVTVGQTTQSQSQEVLGPPARVSGDARAVEYAYRPVASHIGFVFIGGPCGLCGYYPWATHADERLWLAFDESGMLCRYASSRDPKPASWEQFQASRGSVR